MNSASANAVVTGAAGGIGLGIATQLIQRGWRVTLADTQAQALEQACAGLGELAQACVCDVTDRSQLEQLWEVAASAGGTIELWVNNAGVGSDQSPIIETDPALLNRVIEVNIKGVVYGSQVAAQGMIRQQQGGAIYNTAGFGSDGFWRSGMTIYGTSKRAVQYFSKGFARELEGSGVRLGWLNPGMVVTPLVVEEARIMAPEQWAAGRRVFNMWGETVEATTVELVEAMLANQRNGVNIRLLPPWKMLLKAVRSLWRKRDLFEEYGV